MHLTLAFAHENGTFLRPNDFNFQISQYESVRQNQCESKTAETVTYKNGREKRMYPTGINKKDTINHPVRHIHIQAS